MARRYSINDITAATHSSCVVIYSRLEALGLKNKKAGSRYSFTQEQFDRIKEALREDKRYTRKYHFTPDEKALIASELKKGKTELEIAKLVFCDDSTISKYKKKMLEQEIETIIL